MLIKAQIRFTRQQIEQLDELRQQTGVTLTKLVLRAVYYYLRGTRENGVQKALLLLPTDDTREVRQKPRAGLSLHSLHIKKKTG